MVAPFLSPAGPLQAQPVTTLPNPYLQNKNSTVEKLYFLPATGAVETAKGRKILRPGLMMLLSDYDVPEVELSGSYFDLMDTATARVDTGMHFDYRFYTFNKKGELLYHPFPYDNGPDYWSQGRRRFIEGDKMGLVNRLGQRTVPAGRYSFIVPLQKGYAIGCRNCVFTVFDSTDAEHGTGYAGTEYEVIDANGKLLHPLHTTNPDSIIATLNVRRQFTNPQKTAQLKSLLRKLPETREAEKTLEMRAGEMEYVCYDEPTALSPYYHFGLEDTSGSGVFPPVQFLISADGKTIFHISRDLDQITPYAIWRKEKGKWD